MSQAERLLAAYEGSQLGHGTTSTKGRSAKGKLEADSRIVRGPLTLQMVQDHIDGKAGYGAIPITAESTARWGALDIDVYADFKPEGLAAKIGGMGLPAIVCRSKSGGAHVYVFLKDFVPAYLLRESLTQLSILLGYDGCEVFPKQDNIYPDRGDTGNFINMPYHDAEMPMRYGYSATGDALTLDEFLDRVDEVRVSIPELENAIKNVEPDPETGGVAIDPEMGDWLPCVAEYIRQNGAVSSGGRNNFLMHVAVWAKKKSPEHWEDLLIDFNNRYVDPPVSIRELETSVLKSLRRKNYGFKCKESPFCNLCDKSACRRSPYGIGSGEATVPALTAIRIIESDPKVLIFSAPDGTDVRMKLTDLFDQKKFREQCAAQTYWLPDVLKGPIYQEFVRDILTEAQKIEAEDPTMTLVGRLEKFLIEYGSRAVPDATIESAALGQVARRGETLMFRLSEFTEFLDAVGFEITDPTEIALVLKKSLGGTMEKVDNNSVWLIPNVPEEKSAIGVQFVDETKQLPF